MEKNTFWILVENELPNDDRDVLVCVTKFKNPYGMYIGYFENNTWHIITEAGVLNEKFLASEYAIVTGWQELPEYPKLK